MEAKLLTYERVQGLVFGAFGEASEPLHRLIDHLADSRVNVARPQTGKHGQERTAVGEKAAVVGQLRRNLSVAAIHSQCLSLNGLRPWLPVPGSMPSGGMETCSTPGPWTERGRPTQKPYDTNLS